MHSRIIHRVAFVPDCTDRAVTCSGDQSIKFFWLTDLNADNDSEKSVVPRRKSLEQTQKARDGERRVQSVHANEPFTSFTFCGDSAAQTLVAAMSFALRIYKMRTMSLMHTIHLKDLKSKYVFLQFLSRYGSLILCISKTPITAINSHPDYDNYALISSDNRITLFDLATENTLRTYTTREILPNTRIEGLFSPCGNFVYCGSADIKTLSSFSSVSKMRQEEEQAALARGKVGKYGVYIWRVHTGKLEKAEMKAIVESAFAAGETGAAASVLGVKW